MEKHKIELKLKLVDIAACIYQRVEKNEFQNIGGLYGEEFGILLFLFYYSEYSKDLEPV